MGCSVGGLLWNAESRTHDAAMFALQGLIERSSTRGLDSWGVVVPHDGEFLRRGSSVRNGRDYQKVLKNFGIQRSAIFNCRAEPTTEVAAAMMDGHSETSLQPFTFGNWCVAHNGTIANDKALMSAYLEEELPEHWIDSMVLPRLFHKVCPDKCNLLQLRDLLRDKVIGSYSLVAINRLQPHQIVFATNYKPLAVGRTPLGFWLGSFEEWLPGGCNARLPYETSSIPPYTIGLVDSYGALCAHSLWPEKPKGKPKNALVVCSGGLDSVTAAVHMQEIERCDVELLHFTYGCRAEKSEVAAIEKIVEMFGWASHTIPLDTFTKHIKHSRLTNPLESGDLVKDAGGQASAEFAHEYVPCRNLIMLSIAAAFAEPRGIDYIVLGGNLEESSAYPDNEAIFAKRFNEILPHATNLGNRVQLLMPFENLMKHNIVAHALELERITGKPFLDHTHSCYEHSDVPCGICGPCYMRRTAFAMNGQCDRLTYRETSAEYEKVAAKLLHTHERK